MILKERYAAKLAQRPSLAALQAAVGDSRTVQKVVSPRCLTQEEIDARRARVLSHDFMMVIHNAGQAI